jgi:hypothetical protein
MSYNLYDATSGQFSGAHFDSNEANPDVFAAFLAMNTPTGFATYVGGAADPIAQRFDIPTQTIVSRGACPITAAVVARVVTLSGVPSDAAYTISGDAALSGTCDESGTLALAFGAAGNYAVAIPCFPLLDYLGSFTLA